MAEKELANIISGDNILDSENVLADYSSDLSFVPRVRPRCVVKLENIDEVQALVRWANETSTPLVPVSSGAPHFRGDTVPSAGGVIIVDLSGVNNILRVDRRNRVAMVEPGVTFSQLVPALEKEGLRLNIPLLPRSNKSVIGSMLEREPVIMPLYQWDVIDPLVCIEVIFGTGDMFRTGSSAGPGTLEEQWGAGQAQVNPMGPGATDFARVVQGAQGTMGIVTWATIKCEAFPSMQKPFLVGSESIEPLSELVYRLLWLKAVDECLLLNDTNVAAILAKEPDEYSRIKDSLPRWLLFFCLAGYQYYPEERVAYQEEAMLEISRQLSLEPTNAVAGISADKLLEILGKPSAEPYWKIRSKGSCQDIFFLSTLDKVPHFVEVMNNHTQQCGYPVSNTGIYVQPMVQGTSCHCEFNLFYDPNDSAESFVVRDLFTRAGEALMNAGAFFSRPYGALTGMVYQRDGETMTTLRKVKNIFDPNNIMNSGKLCF